MAHFAGHHHAHNRIIQAGFAGGSGGGEGKGFVRPNQQTQMSYDPLSTILTRMDAQGLGLLVINKQ